jgi:hypothetical protein
MVRDHAIKKKGRLGKTHSKRNENRRDELCEGRRFVDKAWKIKLWTMGKREERGEEEGKSS